MRLGITAAVLVVGLMFAGACKKRVSSGPDAKAESLAPLWAARDWPPLMRDFDARMKASLTAEMLDATVDQAVAHLGAYKSHGKAITRAQQGYVVADVPLMFERGGLKMRVAFNSKRKISGFYILVPEAP